MSDERTVDYNAAMAKLYRDMVITLAFLCAGLTFSSLVQSATIDNVNGIAWLSFHETIMVIGWIVAGFPAIIKMMLGGMFSGLFKYDHYEMVTVDGSGRIKSTDGGFQAAQTNLIFTIIKVAIIIFVGWIIQFIGFIQMSFK